MRSLVIVFFTFCIICCSILPSKAQDKPGSIPFAEDVTFLGTEKVAALVVKNVFAVHVPGPPNTEGKPTWISVGSGFFVAGSKVTAENTVLPLGITCKHVIDDAQKDKKGIYIGLDTDSGYQRYQVDVLYIDAENDIAVIRPLLPGNKQYFSEALSINDELFDDGKSLVEGRGLLIIGYPLSLGTEGDINHPVVRFGMIAQNTGKNTFLLDGVASHGNSGSPVVTLKGTHFQISGMITSFQNDQIILYDEHGQISAALPYNSGLARAVKASLIVKAVEEAKKKL